MAEKKKRDRSEYQRQYYLKRREELLARHKQWGKDNVELKTEEKRRERARKKLAKQGGDIIAALDAIVETVTVYDVLFADHTERYNTMEEAQEAYKRPGAKDIKILEVPKE